MLRSRFESVPTAFCRRLVPPSDAAKKDRHMVLLILIDLLIISICSYIFFQKEMLRNYSPLSWILHSDWSSMGFLDQIGYDKINS